MQISWHAAVAGAIGGATALGDLAAPGLAPIVDLGVGAAIAVVAVDSIWTVARRRGATLAPHELFVASVAGADVTAFATPAAPLLGLASAVLSGTGGARAIARTLWSGARALVAGHALDFVPGVATAARAIRTGVSAREAARLVGAVEQAAERACQGRDVRTPTSSNVLIIRSTRRMSTWRSSVTAARARIFSSGSDTVLSTAAATSSA
jgi:hypothetical protein